MTTRAQQAERALETLIRWQQVVAECPRCESCQSTAKDMDATIRILTSALRAPSARQELEEVLKWCSASESARNDVCHILRRRIKALPED